SGNAGVAGKIQTIPDSIGYVELAYTVQSSMKVGKIRNPAGNFVLPSLASTAAAAASVASFPTPSGDWNNVSILDAAGANSYPIGSFTYLLVYQELNTIGTSMTQAKAQAVVAFGVIGLLILITVILSLAPQESIRTFGLGFLSGNVWNPVPPLVFGSVPFVYGTLVTSALALLFGVPISLGIAIFLSELSPPWLRIPLTYIVELLAAVPSVVYGLWGIFVLGPVMRVSVEPVVQDIFGF